MRRYFITFLFLFCFTIWSYSQETDTELGEKRLKKIRTELQNEEGAKRRAIEEERRAKMEARKLAEKRAIAQREFEKEEKIRLKKEKKEEIERAKKEKLKVEKMARKAKIKRERLEAKEKKRLEKQKQLELNESLKERVLRSKKTPKIREEETNKAFELGAKRMISVKKEEEEIVRLGKELGIKPIDSDKFVGKKFDETYEKFQKNKDKKKPILEENEELQRNLETLKQMKEKLQGELGRN